MNGISHDSLIVTAVFFTSIHANKETDLIDP